MKALAIRPKVPNSAHVIEAAMPRPKPNEVLIKIIEVGICGTDAEINSGLYGEPPFDETLLILGHEPLGELENGDFVVPMVRRPCTSCNYCKAGDQDMCTSGDFTERGIKGIHGAICEYIAEDPRFLIPVPPAARGYAVLLEPMSVIAKGLRHTFLIQNRIPWQGHRALVVGAGPIGLLATLTLRTLGWNVMTVARKPKTSIKATIATQVGAAYHSVEESPLRELAKNTPSFDLIFEASGSAEAAFDSMHLLAANGALCLTSVTGGTQSKSIPIDRLNYDFVLGNKLVFGTVNANRADFIDGLSRLQEIERMYPGILKKLLTHYVSFESTKEMFNIQKCGIKTVFRVSSE